MKRERSLPRLVLQPFLLAFIFAAGVRLTGLEAYSIPSESMAPTLAIGDSIVVAPYSFLGHTTEPKRGDVIVFRSPVDGSLLVKRVIGLPGDHVQMEGGVFINGRRLIEPYLAAPVDRRGGPDSWILAHDHYYVLGDNRSQSVDSRSWGALPRRGIVGRAWLIFWSDGSAAVATSALAASPDGKPRVVSGVRWDRTLVRVR